MNAGRIIPIHTEDTNLLTKFIETLPSEIASSEKKRHMLWELTALP